MPPEVGDVEAQPQAEEEEEEEGEAGKQHVGRGGWDEECWNFEIFGF